MMRQSDAKMILLKPSSLARDNARLIASASASSGDVTASKTWLQATKHIPMWFLIMTPTPILEEVANRAASTLTNTVPFGGGGQWGTEIEDTRLWLVDGLNK
jgi:hypothetical protein